MNDNLLHDHSAEMCVLGSVIISEPKILALKAMGLTRDSFHHPAHAIIWDAISDLEVIDLVTIANWLRRHNKLDDVGGEDYLIQVAEEVPSAANAEYYAKIVLETAIRRNLYKNTRRLTSAVGTEPNMAIVSSLAVAVQRDAIEFSPRGLAMDSVQDNPEVQGLSTGFDQLDRKITTRGHPRGQVTVLAAPAKGGKTTLMLDMFLHDLRAGRRVCYATFADLDASGIKRRLMRKLCERECPPEDLIALAEWKSSLEWLDSCRHGMIYDGFTTEDDSVEAFAAWVEMEHRKEPFAKVYVDYAQELRSHSKAAAYSPEQNQAEAARALVRLARRLDLAVVVGSQVTEAPREGVKARTKWSRAWEEKAGWVLVITNHEDLGPFVEITYSRFGPQSSAKHTVGAPVRWVEPRLAFLARE